VSELTPEELGHLEAPRSECLGALDEADEALTVDDLKHPDFYEHHDRALQRLIDFVTEALFREVEETAEDD
jgi:hypothetical protein